MGFFERFKELKHFDESINEKKRTLNELDNLVSEKTVHVEKLKIEIGSIENEKQSIIELRDSEVEKTKREQESIVNQFKSQRESAESEYQRVSNLLSETSSELGENRAKITYQEQRLKLYKSLISQIKKNLKKSDYVELSTEVELDKLCPTVELHLHSQDVPILRKLATETNRIIKETLSRYEARYTTKANKAIYQLMVIALQAELQNILVNLKFSTIEKCRTNLNEIIGKYLQIASDGNQTIAPTLNNFITEIEVLFSKMIDIEYEYFIQKEKEREEQQALREQMRQEAEERRALEQEQKRVEKEESKFKTAIQNIEQQISETTDDKKLKQLLKYIEKLQEQLSAVSKRKEEIINRQNGKAGYVYVISNLGSFGENTFKIGMTRRLEPMDRVRELGDASVPFAFDVHSFIFSDNAVGLEQELHKRLSDKRKNKVNLRKEFFDVSIGELEALVEEINPSAEFNKTMIATEYHRSIELEKNISA